MRSWLFVPGDSEKKLKKALSCGADVLIIDLEDSVPVDAKPAAREISASFVAAGAGRSVPKLYVRVNAFDTGMTTSDLEAVMPSAPNGIVLPKACGRPDGDRLSALLDELETGCGLPRGSTTMLPIITETAASVMAAPTWNEPLARLGGLTWGAEDLSADMGVANPRDGDGAYGDVFRHARLMTLLAAGAGEIDAIDTVYIDFRDTDGLKNECDEAARDGFTGKLAIHPAQVPTINEAFSMPEREVADAEKVIAAFAENPDAGVVGLDGKMLDRPHLRRAERILARAARYAGGR